MKKQIKYIHVIDKITRRILTEEIDSTGNMIPYMNFYEDSVSYSRKSLVYLLQRVIESEEELCDVQLLISKTDYAKKLANDMLDENLVSSERYESRIGLENLFETDEIPEDVPSAVDEEFTRKMLEYYGPIANIILLGKVKKTYVDKRGFFISDLELLGKEEVKNVEPVFRGMGFMGPMIAFR